MLKEYSIFFLLKIIIVVFLLTNLSYFMIAQDVSSYISEIESYLTLSNNIKRPYYSYNIQEWEDAWNSFILSRNNLLNIYNQFKNKENINEQEIDEIVSSINDLKMNIDIIQAFIDFDLSFSNRKETLTTKKGLEITINEQSKTGGGNRLRVYFDKEKDTLYLLLSKQLQGQSLASGTSGLGLKTGMMNVILSNASYEIISGNNKIDVYNENGIRKTESEIEEESIGLALNWAGVSSVIGAISKKYNIFLNNIYDFQMIGKTKKGINFSRTYKFHFIDGVVQNFDSSFNYCVFNGNVDKCNKIIYKDWDESIIRIEDVKYNSHGDYNFIPFRQGYTFVGWNSSLDNIINDIIVSAVYQKNIYNVKFIDYDGSLFEEQFVLYGENSAMPLELPNRIGYTFIGWNSTFDNISKNTTIMAQYNINKYLVSFYDYNGTFLGTQLVEYLSNASFDDPLRENYFFVEWVPSLINITSDLNVTAKYSNKLEEINSTYLINSSNKSFYIEIEPNIENAKINLSSLINLSNGSGEIPSISINASNANNVIVNIPATKIQSTNTSWDGTISTPIVTIVSIPSIEGKTRTQGIAIKVGFEGGSLLFSEAVKLTFPGESGKKVAYLLNDGVFNEISTLCSVNSQNWADSNLAVNGECFFDDGNDIIIWTKHFTEFLTYLETSKPKSSNYGGSSSGGTTCKEMWNCSEWSECINGNQTRYCFLENKCYLSKSQRPIELKECIGISNESRKVLEINSKDELRTGLGLGAVIGKNKSFYLITLLFSFIVILISILLYKLKKLE